MGIAAGWSTGKAKQTQTSSHVDSDSYYVGAYAVAGFGKSFLDVQASYAHHDMEVTRSLFTGMSSRTATGDVSANEIRGSIKLGANFAAKSIDFRPFAKLGYVHLRQRGLTERGAGDAGLRVGKSRFEATTASLGFELQGNLGADGRFHPFADVALAHDLDRNGLEVSNNLIGGGGTFRITGARPGRTAGIANIGVAGNLGSAQFRIGYGLEIRERMEAHTISGGVTFRW